MNEFICIQARNPGAGLLTDHGETCPATDPVPRDTHGRRQTCGHAVTAHVHAGHRCGNYCKRHAARLKTADPGALATAPVFFAAEIS